MNGVERPWPILDLSPELPKEVWREKSGVQPKRSQWFHSVSSSHGLPPKRKHCSSLYLDRHFGCYAFPAALLLVLLKPPGSSPSLPTLFTNQGPEMPNCRYLCAMSKHEFGSRRLSRVLVRREYPVGARGCCDMPSET